MFSLFAGVYDSYFKAPQLNLLVVGGQGVGKTTLLERLKVTQFSKKSSKTAKATMLQPCPTQVFLGTSDTATTTAAEQAPSTTPVTVRTAPTSPPKRRPLMWVCPAPERYSRAMDDDDDEDHEQPPPPALEGLDRRTSTQESMESIELPTSSPPASNEPETSSSTATAERPFSSSQEVDVLPKKHMLPRKRIRPTIGMNLAKNISIMGANVNVMDLGGRLVDLWERYYQDCDAVIFVWKLGDSDNDSDDSDDSDSDDERPQLTPQSQLALLEQVRSAIPDDVPFLVLGHVFDDSITAQPNVAYSTGPLLAHYHNPLQSTWLAQATTGQGVRSSLEWLVTLAKQQQRLREQRNWMIPKTSDVEDDSLEK